jgi:hypothetical protein
MLVIFRSETLKSLQRSTAEEVIDGSVLAAIASERPRRVFPCQA